MIREIVRDVSASLDMTKDGTRRSRCSFPATYTLRLLGNGFSTEFTESEVPDFFDLILLILLILSDLFPVSWFPD